MSEKAINGIEDLPDLTINKNIPIPLYYQLKEILLQYIEYVGKDATLPTEVALCEHYGLSRSTVRQALGELVAEGYITRYKGKGSVVVSNKIKQDFLVILESFNDEMRQKGLSPETKVLSKSILRPYTFVAKHLGLSSDQKAVQLIRLRSIDATPIVLVTTYLPAEYNNLNQIINEDLAHQSMYHLMESEYHTPIVTCRRTVEIRLAGEFEAQQLEIEKGSPLQYIETVSYDDKEQPIEFSMAFYRADSSKFYIDTIRKPVI